MDKRIIMLAALALAAVACGDDDGEAGPPVIRPDSGIQTPLDASIDSSSPIGDSSIDSGNNPPPVKGAPGCIAGKPATSKDFLNSCAEGFVEFNDSARLPGYSGTGLATVSN